MVDVIMRVPPLFVIDEILKISMGVPTFSGGSSSAMQSSPDTHQITHLGGGWMRVNSTFAPKVVTMVVNESIAAAIGAADVVGTTAVAVDGLDGIGTPDNFRMSVLTMLKVLACLLGEFGGWILGRAFRSIFDRSI